MTVNDIFERLQIELFSCPSHRFNTKYSASTWSYNLSRLWESSDIGRRGERPWRNNHDSQDDRTEWQKDCCHARYDMHTGYQTSHEYINLHPSFLLRNECITNNNLSGHRGITCSISWATISPHTYDWRLPTVACSARSSASGISGWIHRLLIVSHRQVSWLEIALEQDELVTRPCGVNIRHPHRGRH